MPTSNIYLLAWMTQRQHRKSPFADGTTFMKVRLLRQDLRHPQIACVKNPAFKLVSQDRTLHFVTRPGPPVVMSLSLFWCFRRQDGQGHIWSTSFCKIKYLVIAKSYCFHISAFREADLALALMESAHTILQFLASLSPRPRQIIDVTVVTSFSHHLNFIFAIVAYSPVNILLY